MLLTPALSTTRDADGTDDVVTLADDRPTEDRALLLEAMDDAPLDDHDVTDHLDWARAWGARLPPPGEGRTRVLWEVLASLGARGLQLARTAEPHLDALAILDQAGVASGGGRRTWGVFAAEGPGVRLEARQDGDGCWRLTGDKPWCSLAGRLGSALITAWVDDEQRGLFAVDLGRDGVEPVDEPWVAHGLPDVRSTGLRLDDVVAEPVGEPGWYLERDGFAWGGIGVAAVWFGAAVALARRLARPTRREPDQVALMHLGAVDVSLTAARAVLAQAAEAVDAGRARGAAGALLAARTRGVVAATCEDVLGRVERALGPAPLVSEPEHAARLSDLRLYLRQHHAERDDAALGRMLRDGASGPRVS